jgi:Protein of unknown function (DUF3106)
MFPLAAALLSFSLHGRMPAAGPLPHHRPPGSQQVASGWDDLTPVEKERARQNYKAYQKLPPEKRHDIDQLYEKWRKLLPSDRERFRKKHNEYRGRGLIDD